MHFELLDLKHVGKSVSVSQNDTGSLASIHEKSSRNGLDVKVWVHVGRDGGCDDAEIAAAML